MQPYYIAPEVLRNKYDEKCDIWSCGVILYILLTGTPPFNGANDDEILKRVGIGKVNYDCPELLSISKEAISFLKQLLNYNPKQRIKAADALEDPWIKQANNKLIIPNGIANRTFEKLKNFKVNF